MLLLWLYAEGGVRNGLGCKRWAIFWHGCFYFVVGDGGIDGGIDWSGVRALWETGRKMMNAQRGVSKDVTVRSCE